MGVVCRFNTMTTKDARIPPYILAALDPAEKRALEVALPELNKEIQKHNQFSHTVKEDGKTVEVYTGAFVELRFDG